MMQISSHSHFRGAANIHTTHQHRTESKGIGRGVDITGMFLHLRQGSGQRNQRQVLQGPSFSPRAKSYNTHGSACDVRPHPHVRTMISRRLIELLVLQVTVKPQLSTCKVRGTTRVGELHGLNSQAKIGLNLLQVWRHHVSATVGLRKVFESWMDVPNVYDWTDLKKSPVEERSGYIFASDVERCAGSGF